MKPLHRRIALYGVLALFASGAAWMSCASEDGSSEIVTLSAVRSPLLSVTRQIAKVALQAQLHAIERPRAFVAESNPFASTQWLVAQAPVAAPVTVTLDPQAPPTAPSLPFAFAGKLEETPGRWIIYLVKGDQSFALNKGDVFDTDYRFDGVEDGHAVIFYLPLATRQFLPTKMTSTLYQIILWWVNNEHMRFTATAWRCCYRPFRLGWDGKSTDKMAPGVGRRCEQWRKF